MTTKTISSSEFLKLHTEATKAFKQIQKLQAKAAKVDSDLAKLRTKRLGKLHDTIDTLGRRHAALVDSMAQSSFRAASSTEVK